MKVIIMVCFTVTTLLAREYPYIVYDSDKHIGNYELAKTRIPEPRVLKSIQNIILNGRYKIIGGYGDDSIANFENGKRHGQQISYVPMSNYTYVVKQTSFYLHGKLEGEYTKHSYKGNLLEIGTYKNNIPVGVEKQYGEDGNLTAKITYIDGLASLRVEYNNNGNIKKKIFYNKNACKEKEWIYDDNGSISERTYTDKVKFDTDRLSKVLALAYLKKSCTLEDNTYKNVMKKYYYAGERWRNVSSEKTISWKNVEKLDEYNEGIYSEGRLVESRFKTKKETIGIAYFDKNEKLRKAYWKDEGIYIPINNEDGSKDEITCSLNGKFYEISHQTKYELGLSDSHGIGHWEEYPYPYYQLQHYEYKALIRKDKLRKHAKIFFDRLKREVLKSADLKSKFVESTWSSDSTGDSELEVLYYFNKEQKIIKIIDFKSQKTTNYHYSKKNKNTQITCLYKRGICTIEMYVEDKKGNWDNAE